MRGSITFWGCLSGCLTLICDTVSLFCLGISTTLDSDIHHISGLNWKGSKVKVTAIPNMVKSPLLGSFCHHKMLNDDSLKWSIWICYWGFFNLRQSEVKRSKIKIMRPNMVEKGGGMLSKARCWFPLIMCPIQYNNKRTYAQKPTGSLLSLM